MLYFKNLAVICLATPLLVACSSGPSDSVVEGLIAAQYEQAHTMMDDAMSGAGNSDMASAMSGMMQGMMPKLESVSAVNCDSAEGKETYRCTADITQNINGNSRTNKTSFTIYKINDEWVIGN